MLKSKKLKNLDAIFAALANQHRREIVYALGLQPYTITQLAHQRKLSLPAIHKHIDILEKAHIIVRRKIGKSNVLAFKRDALRVLQDWLMEYHTYWGNNGETLDNYTEFVKDKTTGERR